MLKDEYKVYEDKMKKSIESVANDFAAVRAGRANASVLNRINVDYYGTPTPIQQIASVGSPDPRTLLITPWDANALKSIEKAIQESDLGINPQNDGKSIRLAFPRRDRWTWAACPAISLSLWTATVVGQRSVGFRALPAIK